MLGLKELSAPNIYKEQIQEAELKFCTTKACMEQATSKTKMQVPARRPQILCAA